MGLRHGAFAACIFATGLIAACTHDRLTRPGQPYRSEPTLRVGEHQVLGATRTELGFQRVTGDSRCPKNVACVWAGAAAVRLWLLDRGGDSAFVTVGINDPAADAPGFRITAIALDPYPENPGPIAESLYRLKIKVEQTPR